MRRRCRRRPRRIRFRPWTRRTRRARAASTAASALRKCSTSRRSCFPRSPPRAPAQRHRGGAGRTCGDCADPGAPAAGRRHRGRPRAWRRHDETRVLDARRAERRHRFSGDPRSKQRQQRGAQWRAETGLDAGFVERRRARTAAFPGALELLAEIGCASRRSGQPILDLRATVPGAHPAATAPIRPRSASRVLPRLLCRITPGIPFSGARLGKPRSPRYSPDALAAFHRDSCVPTARRLSSSAIRTWKAVLLCSTRRIRQLGGPGLAGTDGFARRGSAAGPPRVPGRPPRRAAVLHLRPALGTCAADGAFHLSAPGTCSVRRERSARG